ncbi:peptide ABC transporter substrate-binding protein [Pigmentibacter ruber]|uniref:peptide ABC transporter substrate-binding protein n=1 Tax=Pigmentibacter ruber TaxID=2683196 RepID=UPI00131D5F6A|nr:peptide ABC transporter substrate-binding protein [Pigmentibacter ruber]
MLLKKTPNFSAILFSSLFAWTSFVPNAFAAEVPAGVKLSSKQVLNVGIGAEVPSLDPQKAQDTVSARVLYDLFEGLLVENEKGEINPGVANKWEISKDGLTYTFHIRPEAKFSDGSPITADDAVFSVRRLVDPKLASAYAELILMIKNAPEITTGKKKPEELGVKALDKSTVQFSLNKPCPYFLKIVAFQNLSIVQKANVEKFGDQFSQPGNLVSSGAYKLKYWKIGDKITTERNKMYWNNAKTVIESANYFPISDVNTELQMYQTGQLDITYDIPSDKFKDLKKSLGKQLKANPFLSTYYVSLNTNVEPFKNNVKLRQALSMAVDRKVLTEKVTGRGELPSYDIVPFGMASYKQQSYSWEKFPASQRIAEAQRLYKEAGYSKEKPLVLTYTYNTNALHKKVAIALAAMWEQNLGLKMNLVNQEWKVFLTERNEGRFITARDGWSADYNDPSTYLDLFISHNPQNNPKYKNPKYDELIQKASLETNPTKRSEILQQASSVMLNDYPIISLYTYVTTHLVKNHVGGYSGENPLDHMYTKNFYIVDSSNSAIR